MSSEASHPAAVEQPTASPFERLAAFRLTLSWELVLYAAFIGAGAGLRFWDLGARAFHHDESLHAQYAWYLFDRGNYEHLAMMHGPFQFFGSAFMYVLFGASDYTARVLYAFAGTALIALPFFLRRHLGTTGALAAAGLIAFSPTLLYFSRFARNDIYVAVWTLGLAICLWRYITEGRHLYLYVGAALLGLSFATKEVTYLNVAIFIAFLNLWVAQEMVTQVRKTRELNELVGALLFLVFGVFAWALVALRPFLNANVRRRLGLEEMPRAAVFLLVLGTLSLPQFAAAIQIPLERYGIVGENDWGDRVFTLNLGLLSGSEKVSVEELTGFLTVTFLIAATAVVGLAWNWRAWLIVAALFYVPFGLLYTTFLTNPDGFGSGMWNSLDYWLEQQGEERGSQPFYYYLVLLPTYEFLPLLFALLAAAAAAVYSVLRILRQQATVAGILLWAAITIAGAELIIALTGNVTTAAVVIVAVAMALLVFSLQIDMFPRFLIFWMLGSLLAYAAAGEKMPWLNVHLTLPVVLLAAYALNQLWGLTREREWTPRLPSYAWPLVAAVLAAGAAAFAVFGPTGGAGNIARILVGAAAILAIAALAVTLRGRGMILMPTGAVVGALLLFSIRAAWMASFQQGDGADANEMLVYTQSSPDIPQVMRQIETVAAESGLGYDLPIAVDGQDAFTWPWAWYLRDYNKVNFSTMSGGREPETNAVVLVNGANEEAMRPYLDGYGPGQRYVHRWWFDEGYKYIEQENIRTTLFDFLKSLTDGDTWDTWWTYFRDRQPPDPKGEMYAVAYFPLEFAPAGETPAAEAPVGAPEMDEDGRFTLGGQGSAPGLFATPVGLAVDSEGNLYVADSGNNRIQKFDRDGRFVAQVGSLGTGDGQFHEPWGVAIDSEGNIYVADTWNHRIQKFDRDLNYVTQWGRPTSDLSRPKAYDFWGPRDLTVDAEGNVWVVDTGTSRILKFAPDGAFLSSLGGSGTEEKKFREPVGIEVGPEGDVFVADAWNRRVQHFDRDLNYVGEFPIPGWAPDDPNTRPFLVLLPDGDIVVSEPAGHRLVRLGPDGAILGLLEGIGQKTPFANPTGLALDDRGFLYVASSGLNQIVRILATDIPTPIPTPGG